MSKGIDFRLYKWKPFKTKGPLIILFLVMVLTCISAYASWGGLIWTWDSFHYWHASQSFSAEGILIAYGDEPFSFWPPLYPIVLSLFSEEAYRFIHLGIMAFSMLAFYQLSILVSKPLSYIFAFLLIVLSVFPYLQSSFLWSEALFMCFLFSGCVFYWKWESTKKSYFLIAYTLLFACMCLQRNAGIFIMLGLSFYSLLYFIQHKDWPFLLKNAAAIFLAVLPNLWWNIYQVSFNSKYFDVTERTFFVDFFENLTGIAQTVYHIFSPYSPFNAHSELSALFYLLFLSAFLLLLLRDHRKQFIFWMLFFYLIGFGIMPKIDWGETDRFIAPMFPIIALLMAKSFSKIFYFKKPLKYKIIFFSIALTLLLYNGIRMINNVNRWHDRSINAPKAAKIFFD